MDVIARADADIAEPERLFARQAPIGCRDLAGGGELDIGRFAGDDAHCKARPFRHAGIVGEGKPRRGRPFMGVANRREVESLRCLRGIEAFARDGRAHLAVGPDRLQRARDRQERNHGI